MPRPKGSKNKSPISIEERIDALKTEIEDLSQKLSTKKTELKTLELEKKNKDNEVLLKAIANSGLSIEEVLERING